MQNPHSLLCLVSSQAGLLTEIFLSGRTFHWKYPPRQDLSLKSSSQAGLLTEKELVRLETLQEVTENKHYVSQS